MWNSWFILFIHEQINSVFENLADFQPINIDTLSIHFTNSQIDTICTHIWSTSALEQLINKGFNVNNLKRTHVISTPGLSNKIHYIKQNKTLPGLRLLAIKIDPIKPDKIYNYSEEDKQFEKEQRLRLYRILGSLCPLIPTPGII